MPSLPDLFTMLAKLGRLKSASYSFMAETPNDSWREEHTFWFTKSSRAAIRYAVAEEEGDQKKMNVALKQMQLYNRRMKAAVPEEAKEISRQRREDERRAALNDE